MTIRRRNDFPGLDPRATRELLSLQDELIEELRQLRIEAVGVTTDTKQKNYSARFNERICAIPPTAGIDVTFPASGPLTQNRWIEVLKLGGGDIRIRATSGQVQGAALHTLTSNGFYYYQSDGKTGWWIQPSSGGLSAPVLLTQIQNIANATWLGNISGGAAPPTANTVAQLLTYITSTSGGGTTNFLRADGTFAAPAGGGGTSDAYAKLIASMRA